MIILFDLDGTLIDSTKAIVGTFHYSFDIHNYQRPESIEIEELIGYPLDVMYSRLGVPESDVWTFVATYKKRYREIFTQETKMLASAREAVEKASKFATLGIVTTKTGKYSKLLMEHFELMHYFEVLIGREDVENPKPDKEPILKAIEALNIANDKDIWMIGDTKLDLQSAKNAKVNSIGVLTGYGSKEVLQKFTTLIYPDALDAVNYLHSRKISHIL